MPFLLRIPILNWKRSPLRKPGPEYFVTLQTISSLPLIPQQLNAQRISLHPVESSKTNGNGRIQIRFFSRHLQLALSGHSYLAVYINWGTGMKS